MFAQLVKKIIRETFTSVDMQTYLCENIESLDKSNIVDIVRKAFIPLSRKQEMFDALCEYENKEELVAEIALARKNGYTFEEDYIREYSYYYQSQLIKRALAELENKGKEQGVLPVKEAECGSWKEEDYEQWHIVEKYDEDSNLTYAYYLFDGQIIYFDDVNSKCGSDVFGGDLILPVPFKAGDIITCDSGPNGKETIAVILRVGDNKDCCSLVGLCKRVDGTLEYVAVKHTTYFYGFRSCVYIPPLFSAKIANVEKMNGEEALMKISKFINGDEERGYIVENAVYNLTEDEVTDEWVRELERNYHVWKCAGNFLVYS